MSAERISVINAVKLIEDKKAQVVDIRDITAFGSGHIKNAVRIDNANIQEFIDGAELDKPLLVCCYHGQSSIAAANFFQSQGFNEVYSLDGGMSAWAMAQPTVTGE